MGDNIFHAHLDVCERCREHPFALCPEGQKKLKEAALATPILMASGPTKSKKDPAP